MNDEYTSLQKAQDATEFARSRFGSHYLAKLEKARQRARDDAETYALAGDRELEHVHVLKAAHISRQMDYFDTAQKIATDPSLVERLRRKVTGKEAEEDSDL